MSGTLVSSLVWVPKGKAALRPKQYTLDETELQRVGKLGGPGVLEKLREEMEGLDVEKDEWEDVDDESSASGSGSNAGSDAEVDGDVKMDVANGDEPKKDDDLSAFNMDAYDQEQSKGVAMGAFANVKGLSFYRDNNEDPYITLKEDDEEAEREELELRPTDSMIISARTTSDLSSLDFHVYDEPNESLYVHHDLMLPSFPLCVEWLDFDSSSSSSSGNYVAVGTFDPTIEIWDADMVDGLYPHAILGPSPETERPQPKTKGTGKKKRKQVVADNDYHNDAVISLSWTPNHRHLLLSGSADTSVKLWDLTRESPMPAVSSWDQIHGGEKVQAVEWNKNGGSIGLDKAVLSAGYDRMVKVWDLRSPDEGLGLKMGSDVECIRWDPWDPTCFYVSLENGLILSYDSRTLPSSIEPLKKGTGSLSTAQPRYTLSAHESAASAFDVNPHIRGCLVTGGMDKQIKIWNVSDSETEGVTVRSRQVSLVTNRDLGLGKVFTAKWSPDPDTPLTLAAAGSKATVQVWDVATNIGARKAFGERLKKHGRELKEKKGSGVVGVDEDEEEDDE